MLLLVPSVDIPGNLAQLTRVVGNILGRVSMWNLLIFLK